MVQATYSTYSPDLAPCDIHLFPEIKKELIGRRFEADLELNSALIAIPKELSKNLFLRSLSQVDSDGRTALNIKQNGQTLKDSC